MCGMLSRTASKDAANIAMRSNVMIAIKNTARSWNAKRSQVTSARHTQPCLNDLLQGKISKFSLGTLATLTTRAGSKVQIKGAGPMPCSNR